MDIRQIQAMANNNQPELQEAPKEEEKKTSEVAIIKQQLEAESKPEEQILVKREEDISFFYQHQDGQTKPHTITSYVLNGEGRNKMARIQTGLSGGVSFSSLPADEQGRITCIARIATQVKDCPDYLLEIASEDLDFCFELATQLVRHEMRYFRGVDSQGEIKEDGKRFSFGKTIS
jgi:hypothetical protein